MKTFKQILQEWPYSEHKDKIFDLELEKIKSYDDFVTFLKYLTSGIVIKDKYGNSFSTKTKNGKERFKDRLLQDQFFTDFASLSFKISKDKLSRLVKSL